MIDIRKSMCTLRYLEISDRYSTNQLFLIYSNNGPFIKDILDLQPQILTLWQLATYLASATNFNNTFWYLLLRFWVNEQNFTQCKQKIKDKRFRKINDERKKEGKEEKGKIIIGLKCLVNLLKSLLFLNLSCSLIFSFSLSLFQ